MSKGGFFKASAAMLALGAGFAKAGQAVADFGKMAAGIAKTKSDWEPRVKGKNRKRRGRPAVRHDANRFARKMAKHGMVYAPGKLFKGHRI